MEIIGFILIIIGALISFIYNIQLLIEAFKASILWGLGYMFVPFVAFIFIILHWDRAGSPFLKALIAIPFILAGSMCIPTA